MLLLSYIRGWGLKDAGGGGRGRSWGLSGVRGKARSLFTDPYFLFKVRRVGMIKIKTAGDLLTPSARG